MLKKRLFRLLLSAAVFVLGLLWLLFYLDLKSDLVYLPASSFQNFKDRVGQKVQKSLPAINNKEPLVIDLGTVVAKINNHRKENNLSQLNENQVLQEIANLKAEEIMTNGDWLEESDKTKKLLDQKNYVYQLVGESNLFLPEFGSEVMIDEWLKKESDFFLESKYQQIGLASVAGQFKDSSGTLLVVILARPFVPTPTPTAVVISESELWQALTVYRQAHQKPALEKNEKLCLYARARANELLTRLSTISRDDSPLDNHAGFIRDTESGKAFEDTGFVGLAENLSYDPPAVNATQVIEWGWDSSAPHRESLLDQEMTHACVTGDYPIYVAILGRY